MKTLLSGILVAATMVSVAEEYNHADVSATVSGYYDVTLTTKRLAHSEKTVTKTFTTSTSKGKAVVQFKAEYDKVSQYAGFEVLDVNGKVAFNLEELDIKKITFKYKYFDFKTDKKTGTNYITKVVSDSCKGVYDSNTGFVYLWNTLAAYKVSVTNNSGNSSIILSDAEESKKAGSKFSGFVAYQVPLAMDKQFVATTDNKAAGGFTGSNAVAENEEELNFDGFTAFGTGTLAKDKTSGDYILSSVAGNVAMKDPADIKYGAYGTWKIQKDSSSKTAKAANVKEILRNKGCVELFMERN